MEGNPRPCGAGVDIGAYELCEIPGNARFRRGDSNGDGTLNVGDPVAILYFLFGSRELHCLDAADADSNDALEITDAVRLLGYLFLDAAPPAAPFEECGVDSEGGGPGCERYERCP